jgi:hypothetical protein
VLNIGMDLFRGGDVGDSTIEKASDYIISEKVVENESLFSKFKNKFKRNKTQMKQNLETKFDDVDLVLSEVENGS